MSSPPSAESSVAFEGPLARIQVLAPVSIIIPTYKEAANIPHIIARLNALRQETSLELEVLFMDDNSNDGSVEAVEAAKLDWVHIVVRTENRGLSPAVLEGLERAKSPILVCMDADLSHPPEKIPQMCMALESGQEFVLGSRYVPGGSTDDDWGLFRWLNSRVATLLARPLTNAKDPMSGFFAMRRREFQRARDLNPVGYKIALELIVKCGIANVGEVPIHFSDRIHGESKLTLSEQLRYIRHLRRLYVHKFTSSMELLQFLAVGATGAVVNLAVLSLTSFIGAAEWLALALGIAVSVVSNFVLNRRFTFSYARDKNVLVQFFGFLGASTVGLLVNYSVALWIRSQFLRSEPWGLQGAAMIGIVSGMSFNFLINRFIVFRKRHIVAKPD